MKRPSRAVAVGAILAATIVGQVAGASVGVAEPSRIVQGPGSQQTAKQALDLLKVKGRAPRTGYSREQFGPAWYDSDSNGCDTRNDMLKRDLSDIKVSSYDPCVVLSGTLKDPYTGKTIPFVRGQQTSLAVQVDHVVALSDAWQKGAQAWSYDQRVTFANDPENLLAVDGPTNMAKGDSDAAAWLPPNKSFRCQYVARQIAVKVKYSIWVTKPEKVSMARVLDKCPGQVLP